MNRTAAANRAVTLPVAFLPARLAVNEAEAIELLGLKTLRCPKRAFAKFRALHDIPTEPGGVFSVTRLERALVRPVGENSEPSGAAAADESAKKG